MGIKVLDDSTLSKYIQGRIKDLNMKSTQKDYTKYRIERAWKTFEDAKSLDRIPLIAQISNLKSQISNLKSQISNLITHYSLLITRLSQKGSLLLFFHRVIVFVKLERKKQNK
jgi:hypothetical protein